jgi:hypothetical protein
MIIRGRDGICTGVGGGGIIVRARLLLLAGSDELLARLEMSDATPLGRWKGFRLHYGRLVSVTPQRPSGKWTIASTAAKIGIL